MKHSLLAVLLCLASLAGAAVPQRLNYQGKLADAGGNPLSGTYSFRFKLFAAETGGSALFSEDVTGANAQSVVNGIYSVQIGSYTAGGVPYGVFEGASLYLEIDVNPGATLTGAETLSPRERLNAAAWAVHALGAERLGTGTVIATFTAAGALELPAGSTVSAAGTLTLSTAASAALTGAPAIFIDRGGEVGLGTNNPQYKLDVVGDNPGVDGHTFAVRNTLNGSGAAASFKLITAGAAAGNPFAHFTVAGVTDWTMGIQNNDADKFKITPYYVLGEAPSFTLDTAGRVGVSTGSPQMELDVHGGAQFGGATALKSTFTAVPGGTSYALRLSSGLLVGNGGGVAAAFFDGAHVGDGSRLTGITGSDSTRVSKTGDVMTGQLTITGSSLSVVNTNTGGAGDAYSFATTTSPTRAMYHLAVSTMGQVDIYHPALTVGGSSFVVTGLGVAAGAGSPSFIGNNLSLNGRTMQVFHNQQNAQLSIRSAGSPGIWYESGLGFANRRLWAQQVLTGQITWRNLNEQTGAMNQDQVLVLTSTGAVGVGVSPQARLHVSSGTTATTDNIVLVSTTNGAATTNLFRVQANGNVFAGGAFTGGGADLAEMYRAEPDVEAGDVVEFAPDGRLRRAMAGSRTVMGVISTQPGSLLGWDISRTEMPEHRPLALAGRVPVRFVLEAGPVRRGDALAASSTPGAARRAVPGEAAVAVALEDLDAAGSVLAYVRGADPAARAELDALKAQNEQLRRDLEELRRAVKARGGER